MKKNLYTYLRIRQIDEPELLQNPRAYGRGTLAIFVKAHQFGDVISEKTPREFINKLLSKEEDEACSILDLEKKLDSDYYWLPVYGYHHSDFSFSTKPFNDKWDSGRAGLIVLSKKEAKELYSKECSSLSSSEFGEFIENILEEEVSKYDAYLNNIATEISITLDKYSVKELYYTSMKEAILKAKTDIPAPFNKLLDFVNLNSPGDVKIKAKAIAKVGDKIEKNKKRSCSTEGSK